MRRKHTPGTDRNLEPCIETNGNRSEDVRMKTLALALAATTCLLACSSKPLVPHSLDGPPLVL